MNTLRFPIVAYAFLACVGRPAVAADLVAQPPAPLASLRLAVEPSGLVDVTVQIAGRPTALRLDTGEMTSALTGTSATALGLPRDHVPYREWIVFAGKRLKEFAVADSIRFERFDAPETKFVVVDDGSLPFDIAGKLGADVLRQYDIELDLLREKLNIYSPGQCAHLWPAGAASELALDVTGNGRAITTVQLDGKPVRAALASGVYFSMLGISAATDIFGIAESAPGLKAPTTGIGNVHLVDYPFKTLVLQGVTVTNPDVEIQTSLPQQPDLIIGANILRRLHFCIAYDAKKLYVANASAP
jgi:hypothetical protein